MMMESRALDAYLDPVYTTGPTVTEMASVSGASRYKYSQRPLVPYLDKVPASILVAPTQPPEPLEEPRDVGVQTLYRESEAQTDPYSPEFIGDSKILLLKDMKIRGGKKEIEMIDEARQKHHLMESLPPATDEASLMLRKKLLEAQELRELKLRQKEIDDDHKRRLKRLKEALDDRDRQADFIMEQRVEAQRQTKLDERDAALRKIQSQRIKILRKLSMERHQPATDIIEDYANFASAVYAPITRLGRHPDKNSHDFVVDPKLEPKNPRRRRLKQPTTVERRKLQLAADLLTMSQPAKPPQPLSPKKSLTKKKDRPPTPVVEPRQGHDLDLAVKLLQKLLRGRAVQNLVFEGKQRRLELIRELRASEHVTMPVETTQGDDWALETVAGEAASMLLNHCANELVRREQKDELAALAKRADAERRRREAEEAGTRQAQELVRNRQDEVYSQVMAAHVDTAESYVDQVVDMAVDDSAQRDAHGEIADKYRDVYNERLATARDAFVNDVVASFLAPALDEFKLRKRQANDDHLAYAAQATLQESIHHALQAPAPAPSSV